MATPLVVRLRIELGISRDEERSILERKLRRIDLINALAVVPAALGALELLPRLSNLALFFRFDGQRYSRTTVNPRKGETRAFHAENGGRNVGAGVVICLESSVQLEAA